MTRTENIVIGIEVLRLCWRQSYSRFILQQFFHLIVHRLNTIENDAGAAGRLSDVIRTVHEQWQKGGRRGFIPGRKTFVVHNQLLTT